MLSFQPDISALGEWLTPSPCAPHVARMVGPKHGLLHHNHMGYGEVRWRSLIGLVRRTAPEVLVLLSGAYLTYCAVLPSGPTVTRATRLASVIVLAISSLCVAIQKWLRTGRSVATGLLRLVAASSAVVIAYAALTQASAPISRDVRLAALCLLAISGTYLALQSSGRELSSELQDDLRAAIEPVGLGVLLSLLPLSSGDSDALGFSSFLVEGRGRKRQLRRLTGQRLSGRSAAHFTKLTRSSDGVLSRAWLTKSEVLTLFQAGTMSEDTWYRLPMSVTQDLTLQKFEDLGEACGAVLAVPIVSPFNRVLGIVSVDARPGWEAVLSLPQTRQELYVAANAIGSLIRTVRG